MPNTNNSNVKLGMYKEPIEVGDWCIYNNVLCKVVKINAKMITLIKLDDRARIDENGNIKTWKVSTSPENIFIIAKDSRDIPKYLEKKMEIIERKIEELNFKSGRKRP